VTDVIQIQLSGDKNVRAAFADLRDYLPKQALRIAVRKAAEFLDGLIVLVAPKLTGKLARNIEVHTHKGPTTIRARVTVNIVGKASDPHNAFYWKFLGEGFHTKKGDFRKYPFIANVVDSKNREAAQMVIDSVDGAITRAEAKASKG